MLKPIVFSCLFCPRFSCVQVIPTRQIGPHTKAKPRNSVLYTALTKVLKQALGRSTFMSLEWHFEDALCDGLLIVITTLQLDDMEVPTKAQSTQHFLGPLPRLTGSSSPLSALSLNPLVVLPCWAPKPLRVLLAHILTRKGTYTQLCKYLSEGKALRWQNYQQELALSN